MMRVRTVVLIGTVSLGAGWMVGTNTSPAAQDSSTQRRGGPRPLGMHAPGAAPFTAQLRRRLEEQPRSPTPGRNPFAFGSRRASPAPPVSGGARRETTEVTPVERPMPAPAPVQTFKLSGIAASEKDGVAVLTAIVIDNGSMVFVKAGDKLSAGHSVLRVDETSIVLVNAAGIEQIIRLP